MSLIQQPQYNRHKSVSKTLIINIIDSTWKRFVTLEFKSHNTHFKCIQAIPQEGASNRGPKLGSNV